MECNIHWRLVSGRIQNPKCLRTHIDVYTRIAEHTHTHLHGIWGHVYMHTDTLICGAYAGMHENTHTPY